MPQMVEGSYRKDSGQPLALLSPRIVFGSIDRGNIRVAAFRMNGEFGLDTFRSNDDLSVVIPGNRSSQFPNKWHTAAFARVVAEFNGSIRSAMPDQVATPRRYAKMHKAGETE